MFSIDLPILNKTGFILFKNNKFETNIIKIISYCPELICHLTSEQDIDFSSVNFDWEIEDVSIFALFFKENSIPRNIKQIQSLKKIFQELKCNIILDKFSSINSSSFPELASANFIDSIRHSNRIIPELILSQLEIIDNSITLESLSVDEILKIFDGIVKSIDVSKFIYMILKVHEIHGLFTYSLFDLLKKKENICKSIGYTEYRKVSSNLESINPQLFSFHKFIIDEIDQTNKSLQKANQQQNEENTKLQQQLNEKDKEIIQLQQALEEKTRIITELNLENSKKVIPRLNSIQSFTP
jgi:hypothetical protein